MEGSDSEFANFILPTLKAFFEARSHNVSGNTEARSHNVSGNKQ